MAEQRILRAARSSGEGPGLPECPDERWTAATPHEDSGQVQPGECLAIGAARKFTAEVTLLRGPGVF